MTVTDDGAIVIVIIIITNIYRGNESCLQEHHSRGRKHWQDGTLWPVALVNGADDTTDADAAAGDGAGGGVYCC